jgi:hypothetical protein
MHFFSLSFTEKDIKGANTDLLFGILEPELTRSNSICKIYSMPCHIEESKLAFFRDFLKQT